MFLFLCPQHLSTEPLSIPTKKLFVKICANLWLTKNPIIIRVRRLLVGEHDVEWRGIGGRRGG